MSFPQIEGARLQVSSRRCYVNANMGEPDFRIAACDLLSLVARFHAFRDWYDNAAAGLSIDYTSLNAKHLFDPRHCLLALGIGSYRSGGQFDTVLSCEDEGVVLEDIEAGVRHGVYLPYLYWNKRTCEIHTSLAVRFWSTLGAREAYAIVDREGGDGFFVKSLVAVGAVVWGRRKTLRALTSAFKSGQAQGLWSELERCRIESLLIDFDGNGLGKGF